MTTPCGNTRSIGWPLNFTVSTRSHPAPETNASTRLAQPSTDSRRRSRPEASGAATRQRKANSPASDIVEAY